VGLEVLVGEEGEGAGGVAARLLTDMAGVCFALPGLRVLCVVSQIIPPLSAVFTDVWYDRVGHLALVAVHVLPVINLVDPALSATYTTQQRFLISMKVLVSEFVMLVNGRTDHSLEGTFFLLAVVEPYVILGKLDLRIPRHLGLLQKHFVELVEGFVDGLFLDGEQRFRLNSLRVRPPVLGSLLSAALLRLRVVQVVKIVETFV